MQNRLFPLKLRRHDATRMHSPHSSLHPPHLLVLPHLFPMGLLPSLPAMGLAPNPVGRVA